MNIQRIAKLLENKDDLTINEVILNKVNKEKQIIYGARAYNLQSPTHLRKTTYDYDIQTKKPKKFAKEIAIELKRRLGKDIKVVKGSHKGTYRVKIDNETIADYTQLKKPYKSKNVWGIQVRDIKSIKKNVKRMLSKPELSYRKEKDTDVLNRITEIERIDKFFNSI